jgi:hypothetical protein
VFMGRMRCFASALTASCCFNVPRAYMERS